MVDDARNHKDSAVFGQVFSGVAGVVYVLLATGWCALLGALPMVAIWFFVPDLQYYPLWCAAFALSTPGFAALFAVFRDQPVLLSHRSLIRVGVFLQDGGVPEWIARPYIPIDRSYAIFRPFLRAYRTLALRALLQGIPYGLLLFIAAYDAQIVMQIPQAGFLGSIFLVCAVFLVQASAISLILLVEYPKARWLSVLKNGLMLSVRKIYIVPLVWIVFIGYWWGLAQSTVLVALLATGITAYIIWGAARWQSDRLMVMMAQESGDPLIIAMYQGENKQPKGSSFSSMIDQRQ